MRSEVGGRFKREGPCVCLWLIHVDVWQKQSQYCKVIILQLKINFFKNLKLETGRYSLQYTELINDRELLYSTGNCIQYFVVAYNGRESDKEYIYACVCVCIYICIYIYIYGYIWLSRSAVYLKYCRLTIIQ